MIPALSNLHARKQNVAKELVTARAMVVEQMKRHVKTGLGVSESYYKNEPGEPLMGGEMQGKVENPCLYSAQSLALLEAHLAIAPGLTLASCISKRVIKHNHVSFVDDADGHALAPCSSEDPVGECIDNMQQSANAWNQLVDLSGHSLALHKMHWQILAWEFINGDATLIKATEEVLVLEDKKGVTPIINFRGPGEPNEGLGFRFCPDGSQDHHFKFVRKKMVEACDAVASAYLTESEARQVLQQRLIPKLSYPLHLSSFTPAQGTKIDTLVWNAVLPSMRFNRKTLDAVIYGPIEYGGMETPRTYTL